MEECFEFFIFFFVVNLWKIFSKKNLNKKYRSINSFFFLSLLFRYFFNSLKHTMSKPIPKELSEEQIKFWLSNTNLSRDDLLKWYKSFQEFSTKNKKLNRDNFFKFFEQLNHAEKDSETFYKLAFNGIHFIS